MKKVFIALLTCLIYNSLAAQTDRGSIGLVRINGTSNFYNSVHYYDHNKNQRNGTAGFSLELGGKQFLGGSNLFLEEPAGFVFSELPFPEYPLVVGAPNQYPLLEKGNETGILGSVVLGYQVQLKNHLSVDFFAGPDFRYLFNYNAKFGDTNVDLPFHKSNLKLKAGANLNIKRFNISLFASQDLLDRGKDSYRYKTIIVGLGFGYYFRWK